MAAPRPARRKVPLVVYSAQGYDHAMAAAFQKATGIQVKLDDNSTGPLLTQIEASKNNPNWGVLWVDGATAFAGLDTQGLLQNGFEPKVSWDSLGAQSLPADKSYTPTGVTLMAAVVYNKTKVTSPPSTWQQLLSSNWKGHVGMNDPAQSGPTYPFIAGMMNYLGGVSRGESFYTKLKQNGLVINPTNGPTLQALTSGRIKLALVQSSAGIGATFGPSGDKSLAVRYLNPVTLLPSAIGIDANASATERKEAEKFVNFVLSPAGQHVMQTGDPYGDSLYYPVINGVNPLPELPNDGDHHLVGTVADVAFRGRGYEHAIDIAGHGRLTGVFAPFRAERGETVGLRLDPAGCHVFPAVAAQQAAAAAARPAAKVQLSDVGPEFVRPTQRL